MKKLYISKIADKDYKAIDKIFRENKKTNKYDTDEDIVCCTLAVLEWVDNNYDCIEFDVMWDAQVNKKEMH